MSNQGTILLIEDDAAVAETLSEFLRLQGYTVLIATTMQEAEDIRQHIGLLAIDLVVSDVHLTADHEAREGYELYQRWKELYPELPYIFISGDPTSQDLPPVRLGVARLLVKPFNLVELLKEIRTTLEER